MFSTGCVDIHANMIADVAFKKIFTQFSQMLPFYHICFIPPK